MPIINGQPQNGYVALFSTIILSAVFLLLFAGMFLLATGGMSRITDHENAFKASSLAETCKELALNELRNDPAAVIGSTSSGETGNECYVDDVENHSDELVTFSSIGEYGNYKKTIQVDVSISESVAERTVEIIGWSEEMEVE